MRTPNRLQTVWLTVVMGLALTLAAAPADTQNIASQKAYFGSDTTEILNPAGDVILSGAIKTSGVGDFVIGVSMECALWTATSNRASKGGELTTSVSRAAVNVTVFVDGIEATPGQVVYCDRLQQVNLQFQSATVEVTDAIVLEIFQKTKNAQHFNFYSLNPGNGVHHVDVRADSIVETREGSPDVVVANTRAVVGKRTLVIEEYNNP
jgi:hypothetical protein